MHIHPPTDQPPTKPQPPPPREYPGVLLFLLPLLALLPLRLLTPACKVSAAGRWLLQKRLWRGFRGVDGALCCIGDGCVWYVRG